MEVHHSEQYRRCVGLLSLPRVMTQLTLPIKIRPRHDPIQTQMVDHALQPRRAHLRTPSSLTHSHPPSLSPLRISRCVSSHSFPTIRHRLRTRTDRGSSFVTVICVACARPDRQRLRLDGRRGRRSPGSESATRLGLGGSGWRFRCWDVHFSNERSRIPDEWRKRDSLWCWRIVLPRSVSYIDNQLESFWYTGPSKLATTSLVRGRSKSS